MARTLEARLASLKAQIGWRLTPLTSRRGREVIVPTYDLLDAWLAWQLRNEHPVTTLSRRVSIALAGARLRRYEGEMLVSLAEACRDYWRRPERSTQPAARKERQT
jgi:hypothetical protein